jgi:SAM-dependent methyltransferase
MQTDCRESEILAEASRFVSAGDSVLDLGCGSAPWAEFFPPGPISYRGIDLRADVIGRCRRDFDSRPGFRFEVGDVATTALGSAAFDVVSLLNVLHLPSLDPAAVLRKSREALKPGGRLIVAGPSGPDRGAERQGYYCSVEGMEALLKHLGFPHSLVARPDLCHGCAFLVVAMKTGERIA